MRRVPFPRRIAIRWPVGGPYQPTGVPSSIHQVSFSLNMRLNFHLPNRVSCQFEAPLHDSIKHIQGSDRHQQAPKPPIGGNVRAKAAIPDAFLQCHKNKNRNWESLIRIERNVGRRGISLGYNSLQHSSGQDNGKQILLRPFSAGPGGLSIRNSIHAINR